MNKSKIFILDESEFDNRVHTIVSNVFDFFFEKKFGSDCQSKSHSSKSQFLNAKKAGELFGVHPNTIRNWYKAGYFKKYVIEGVSLYDVEQIETFIKSQALEPA